MQCQSCRTDNRPGVRFCVECGASLAVACPSCGFSAEPGERFCGGCGARLGEAPESGRTTGEETTAAAPDAPTEEKRQVTILFADISGYTRLSSELDVEEVHDVIKHFFDTVDGIVEAYGGTVDKHIGDAVMALFGAPIAHGDDPQRAVRAALDMHGAMTRLSGELGRKLEIHVGIASGEVVAAGLGRDGTAHYTVLGESVNLAARLVDRAGPGETLISDAVHGAVSAMADCEPLGEVAVKGLAPIHVWRLKGLGSAGQDKAQRRFVGRAAELGQFAGVIAACRKTGNGQAVLLRGEAGIGKTRLVEELTRIARAQGFADHRALILDFGVGKGQDAVRVLVRSLLGIAPDGGKAVRQAAATGARDAGLVGDDRQAFLHDLLNLPQQVEMRALYDAMDNATRNAGKQAVVGALVSAIGADQPVLLVIEDVHSADSPTLAHLAALTRTVALCPAVLVMTTRIEGDPLDQAWRAATRNSALMTIDLGPLREAEALELASGFIDATQRYGQECIERAEGNPLFLEQLLRNAEAGEGELVPASIQSLILARTDRLQARDKLALQAASVVGQRFPLDLLRHLVEDPGYTCQGLMEQYLVRPEGADFLFDHALIQEGVYASLLKARARKIHQRAARWYAERDADLHALHLDRAEHEAAAGAYLEAARAHAAAYHFERAFKLVRRGLELVPSEAERFALTCLHGELLHDLGSISDSIEAYRAALALADDDAKRCAAWIGVAAGMRIADRFDEAFEALDAAQGLARGQGLARELSQIHYYRGNLFFPLGNIKGCLEEQEKAITFARQVGASDCEARALSGLGDAYYSQGRMLTSLDYFRRAIDLCRAHGLGRIEVGNRHMVAWNRLYRNETRASLEEALSACDAAALVGHRRAEIVARLTAGRTLCELGDFAASRQQLDRGLALVAEIGAARFKAFYMIFLGRIAWMERQVTAATRDMMGEALEISRKTGPTFVGPWVLSTLALASDGPEERRRCLDAGEAILREGCVGHNYLAFYPDAIEVSLDDGAWDAADRYATALESYTRAEPLPRSDFLVARGRALAAFGRGRRDEATVATLGRLRDEAARMGLASVLPALEAAVAAA